MITSGRHAKSRASSCSLAAATLAALSRPDSTSVQYPGGSPGSAWIQHCTALTRSAVPRPRLFIVRPETYVPSSSPPRLMRPHEMDQHRTGDFGRLLRQTLSTEVARYGCVE